MKTLTLEATVDERQRLHADVPSSLRPGPVEITLTVPEIDKADSDWSAAVAAAWAPDWSDPREDIYTLGDGEPVHEGR